METIYTNMQTMICFSDICCPVNIMQQKDDLVIEDLEEEKEVVKPEVNEVIKLIEDKVK